MHIVRLALLLSLLVVTGRAATWLAISPDPALTKALAPLSERRASQGLNVTVSAKSVGQALAELPNRPDYVVLIGDDSLIPAKRGSQYRWLSTQSELFAADPLFSDLNGDGLPEFPVGRIPASTPAQLEVVINKIIAYENRELGTQDLNLPVWSGTPAYGKLLDETADWLLMSTLDKYAPKWAQPWLITANPRNTLNAWPTEQATLFNQQIQRGAAFTAMMGHGNTDLFLSMKRPPGEVPPHGEIVYTNQNALTLDDPSKVSPPLVIFACDCGNFAHAEKASLAETLLLGRGGPVATIAATTESHPLTNYYSSIALMQEISKPDPAGRAGDLWLAAQLSANSMRRPLIERALKNVEGSLDTEINIPKLKRDQTQMYAYLGDPALALALPRPLELKISKRSESGDWEWSVTKPGDAVKLIVQLRPVTKPLRIKPKGADRARSLELFAERNAQFAFNPLNEIPADAEWSGRIKSPGDLRIIALTDSGLRVASKKLR